MAIVIRLPAHPEATNEMLWAFAEQQEVLTIEDIKVEGEHVEILPMYPSQINDNTELTLSSALCTFTCKWIALQNEVEEVQLPIASYTSDVVLLCGMIMKHNLNQDNPGVDNAVDRLLRAVREGLDDYGIPVSFQSTIITK